MGKRNSPEKGCPVMKAFLSISTGTSPWTDDQILAEIKKRNSFLVKRNHEQKEPGYSLGFHHQ